jgi:hypothetical protein
MTKMIPLCGKHCDITTYLKVLEIGLWPGAVRLTVVVNHSVGVPVAVEGDHVVVKPVHEFGLQVFYVLPERQLTIYSLF